MANGQGITIINFGNFPGSTEAMVNVGSLTEITATSKAEAFIMADDTTTDHTASDHRYVAALIGLTCGTPTEGDGFNVYARTPVPLQGTFKLRYVWCDDEGAAAAPAADSLSAFLLMGA